MPPPAIRFDGQAVDLSGRVVHSTAVTGSPAAATETIICTLPALPNVAVQKAVYLQFYCAFTAGTSAVSARLRVRQTDASGTTLADSGAVTVVAASLYDRFIQAVDTSPTTPGQVYVLTLTMGSGAAASTVSAAVGEAWAI